MSFQVSRCSPQCTCAKCSTASDVKFAHVRVPTEVCCSYTHRAFPHARLRSENIEMERLPQLRFSVQHVVTPTGVMPTAVNSGKPVPTLPFYFCPFFIVGNLQHECFL
jgi:hypothetical protein